MTEVDMAMAYSEERKIRMAAMVRIESMLYNMVPFIGAAAALVDAVMNHDTDELADAIKMVTVFRSQLEADLMINLFDPVDGEAYFTEKQIKDCRSLGDLSDETLNELKDTLQSAAKKVYEQWNALAKELGHMSIGERRKAHRNDLFKIIARVKDEIKGSEEKRSPETTH
jgi:hypothetical protein